MNTVTLRAATSADLATIALMNRELIQDEGHRNPMSVEQLEERARNFLSKGDWRIDLLEVEGRIAGFVTWRQEEDITEPSGQRIYLRQFYIARDARGGGIGRQSFEALMSQRFPADCRILLEVLESNPGGREFWARMGFAPYSLFVERRSPASHSQS